MAILVYLGLVLVTATLIGALFLAPSCSLGFRPLLSGYTIVLYTMILYISLSAAVPIFFNNMVSYFFPNFSGPDRFFGTLVVNWIGIILFVGFYHFFSRQRRGLPVVARELAEDGVYFPFIAYACVVVGLALKVLFIIKAGGLHTILVTRSAGVSKSMGLSRDLPTTVLYLSYFSMTADAAATWLVLEAVRIRRQFRFHAALVAVTLATTFLITPKREVLIVPILALAVGYSIFHRPLRLSQAPFFLVGAVAFSMATLAGRIFLPAYAAGITVINWSRTDVLRNFAIRLLSADIAFFDATVIAIYGRELIFAKFGSWWSAFYRPNIEAFFYAVPRLIWPDKPDNLVDVSTAIQSIMLGLPLEKTIGGFGVGLIGTSWFYGGLTGLIVGMALLAIAAAFVDRFLMKMHYASAGRILIFVICATSLFHTYRQGTIGWVFLNFFQTTLVMFLTIMVLTHLRNARSARLPSALAAT